MVSKTSYIIHFSYRGIYDCYNKLYHQKLRNHKPNRMLIEPSVRSIQYCDIPTRVLCFLGEIHNANQKVKVDLDLGITSKSNIELLKSFPYKNIDLFCKRVQCLLTQKIYKSVILGNFPKYQMSMYIMNNRTPVIFPKNSS